jgi:hypothetical protein
MDSTVRPGARWRNNSSNGDASSVQQVAQQYPPSSFEPQSSLRASGDSVRASDCFGAIGSELRGVPATFGVQRMSFMPPFAYPQFFGMDTDPRLDPLIPDK